jgi:excisionase family DNA binding protein
MKIKLKLLAPKEVATMLGVSTGTLANWRVENNFKLPYYKIGKSVRYQISDVEKFAETFKKFK